MNLPNLSEVEIPKRISAGLISVYLITKNVPEFWNQVLAYCFVAFITACQTYTDSNGKKQ